MARRDDETRKRYGLSLEARVRDIEGHDPADPVRIEPDSFTVVTVRSSLEWAAWDRPVVVAGGTVRLTVRGTFVGEGAPVAVTLRDARNRVVGWGEGPMHRDRAVVDVDVDRQTAAREPDGVLAAADVEVHDLGLTLVSAPLLVLPFAELTGAAWGAPEARDGDDVGLSCRLTGTAAGVERAGRETAEVEVLRGDEGPDAVFEPVATLRAPVADGRISVRWQVGLGPNAKAEIATQPALDEAASRTGAEPGRYARPAWRFRVRLVGLEAESPDLGYRDHVDLAWGDGERPAAGAPVEVRLADGTTREESLGDDGRLRLADVPPGPVQALFGPDPRVWEPPADLLDVSLPAPLPLPDLRGIILPPKEPVRIAAANLSPLLLADIMGIGPDDDDEDFVDWLWGTMAGDFNEDADYDQIVANIGASFIPVVGQVMDVRDVFAGLYLLWKDNGWRDPFKWLALFVTLVGIIPVLGDALKGVFRIALRSIRRGTADVAGEAAQALELAFRKMKDILERENIHALDGVESAAQWVRDLDIGFIISWARKGINWVSLRVTEVFTWAAESAESGVLRVAEVWREGLSRVGMLAGQLFRTSRTPPRAVAGTVRLGAVLRAVVRRVETLQAQANAQVDQGLRMLEGKLRELVGVPPRPPGRGVSGGEVRPDGGGDAPRRATAEVIAQRQRIAKEFYLSQGFPDDASLASHLEGIDFNHPVDVDVLNPGDRVRQYQVRGSTFQGSYYFKGDAVPTELGINPMGTVYGTSRVDVKVVNEYMVTRRTQVLRSTAAAVIDDHSVRGTAYSTVGGATQYFVKIAPGIVPVR